VPAYCTAADVKAIAREFASVADADFTAHIARASRGLNPKVWGARIVDACAQLVAHYMTENPPTGATPAPGPSGPIASQTVGSVSVTYAVSAVPVRESAGSLSSTKYGREYSRMVREVAAGPFLAR
jgi:hypothetical protein